MRFILLPFLLPAVFSASGGIVKERLFINRGTLLLVDSTTLPCLAFNRSATFSPTPPVIRMEPDDVIMFTIVNNDTAIHGFTIKGAVGINDTILPGDSAVIAAVQISGTAVFIFYDNYNYPYNRYMGLAGMICVVPASAKTFTWDIREHQRDWNNQIAAGNTVNWSDYYPEYFTVNGRSNPDIDLDSTAKVTGSVGDTILICIANTGVAAHAIHFHGYHCTILFSSRNPLHAGRSKDTFPLYSMETMLLRLVPDKPGEFPVHDHNLVAITGGMYYPRGMLLMTKIQ